MFTSGSDRPYLQVNSFLEQKVGVWYEIIDLVLFVIEENQYYSCRCEAGFGFQPIVLVNTAKPSD